MMKRSSTEEICPIRRVTDGILENIFDRLETSTDRNAVSEVCREWKEVDSKGRKNVLIRNCYSLAPSTLSGRFPNLVSLGIRVQSRAEDFEPMNETWGGYFTPWMEELAGAYKHKIKNLCLRRMRVTDEDLRHLAESFSNSLCSLTLQKCYGGFSSLGLYHITSRCRLLKALNLKDSHIQTSASGGRWLSELAEKNHCLEYLNFQDVNNDLDEILDVEVNDLETLVDNCRFLRSLKVNWEVEFSKVRPFLRRAVALTELGTGLFPVLPEGEQDMFTTVDFPRSIVALSGLDFYSDFSVPLQPEILAGLRFLNLEWSCPSRELFTKTLKHCVGLRGLRVRDILGDDELIIVAEACPYLERIHVSADSFSEQQNVHITPRGLICLVHCCSKLEHLVMPLANLDNASLTAIGKYCTLMKDCRFLLLEDLSKTADLPLDEGVKALLIGCQHLRRFDLSLQHGALTDLGMAYIGLFGKSLNRLLLERAGDSDEGLISLVNGCRSLQKLEMIDCPVSETGLAAAATSNQTLKFIWAQGPRVTEGRGKILAQSRSNWVVETCLETQQTRGTIAAYHSLTKPRVDKLSEISIVVNDGANLLVE